MTKTKTNLNILADAKFSRITLSHFDRQPSEKVVIAIVDIKRNVVEDISSSIENLMGFKREEIVGVELQELFSKIQSSASSSQGIASLQQEFYESRRQGDNSIFSVEMKAEMNDGTEKWLLQKSFMFEEANSAQKLFVILEDITEQKRSQIEYERESNLLKTVAEAANLVISERDIDVAITGALKLLGEELKSDYALVFENLFDNRSKQNAVTLLYQWAKEGRQTLEIIRDSDPEGNFKRWNDMLLAGVPINGSRDEIPEIAFLDKYGPILRSLLVAPIYIRGHFWGFVSFTYCSENRLMSRNEKTIITSFVATLGEAIERHRANENLKKKEAERRLLHEELLQAQKMEALGTLAGGIAHDFSNILTAIMGFASILKTDTPRGKELAGIAERISLASERGRDLAMNLLGFARKGNLEMAYVSVNTLIKDVVNIVTRTFPKEINIRVIFQEDLPLALTEAAQLTHAIMNLCINAKDALPYGGTISIKTELVFLGEEFVRLNLGQKWGDYVLIQVKDNGIGMDSLTKAKAIEPFYTTKEPDKGTGLGLPMVYGMVKRSGGILLIESEPGEGTAIKIYLPAQTDIMKGEGEEDQAPKKKGKGTILVVDDNDLVLEAIQKILSSAGYETLAANEGAQSLELFRRNKDELDLVILDVIMCENTGAQVLRKIMEISPGAKVLLTTGFALNGSLKEFLSEGAKGFLQKPFDDEMLLAKVAQVLKEDKS